MNALTCDILLNLIAIWYESNKSSAWFTEKDHKLFGKVVKYVS